MDLFWEQNLAVLKKKDFLLYKAVREHAFKDIGQIIPTQTVPNLRFKGEGEKFAYPVCDDPIRVLNNETVLPILANTKNLGKSICVFTGMGLGYLPLIVAETRKDLFLSIVLEPSLDLFILALRHVDLSPLLESDRVVLLAGEIDWESFDSHVSNNGFEIDFIFYNHTSLFTWKPDLYNRVRDKVDARVFRAMSAMGTLVRFGERLFKNRMANLTQFRGACMADSLAGAFKGKPAILVSAGPSLGKSIEMLKKAVGKAVIIAVDSAVIPLVNAGISPDFVTTLDFRPLNSEKLSPDLLSRQDFSLVANIFSASLTLKRLKPNRLFFSFQENDSQMWLMEHLKLKYKMPPVNTVAVLSLSFAQMIEADPVILVGYDFALTSQEEDHIKGAVFSHGWHRSKDSKEVPGIDGNPVRTLKFLEEFKQNFENLVKQVPRRYINATAAGAQIEGTEVKSLTKTLEADCKGEFCIASIIDAHAKPMNGENSVALVKAARKQIALAEKSHKNVKNIIACNRKILVFVQKKKQSRSSSLIAPKSIQTLMQKREKLLSRLDPFLPMEEIAAKYLEEARQIQILGKTASELDKIEKDAKVVNLEMEGHHKGLSLFKKEVSELASYLEKEDRILQRIDQGLYSDKIMIDLVELYLKKLDSTKASIILEKCLDAFNNPPEALMLMGECQAQLLDFKSALQYWERAGSKLPGIGNKIETKKREMAEYWLARGLEERSIFDLCLTRGMTLCNDKSSCLFYKETFWPLTQSWFQKFLNEKKFDSAINLLMLWAPIKDDLPEWHSLAVKAKAVHAKFLLETGQVDKGISQLNEAVQQDPDQAVVWEEIGDLLFQAGDYTGASIAYEKCIEVLPDRVAALKKYGDCYLKAGQTEQARCVYQLVLEKDAGNVGAKNALNQIGR